MLIMLVPSVGLLAKADWLTPANPWNEHPSPQAPAHERGIAKFYSRGVMEEVARNRGIAMRKDVSGYAAVADCGKIGSVVLASVGTLGAQRYQVLDCSQTRDLARHAKEGLIIEVDWLTAKRAGLLLTGRAPATIWGFER